MYNDLIVIKMNTVSTKRKIHMTMRRDFGDKKDLYQGRKSRVSYGETSAVNVSVVAPPP